MTNQPTTQQLADDNAVQVLSNEGAQCGDCGDQPGDRTCPDCERCRRWYVAALRKAGWAPQDEHAALVAEIHRLRAELAAEQAPFHLHSATAIADADNPTQLRWGLDDVMWGDEDSVIVLLSGPNGEPYWLELDPDRAAALRQNLAGPDYEPAPTA